MLAGAFLSLAYNVLFPFRMKKLLLYSALLLAFGVAA